MEFQDPNIKSAFVKEGSFQEFISRIRSHWFLFLISILICCSLAFLYTMYAQPVYKINSAITIDNPTNPDQSKQTDNSGSMAFPDMFATPSNAYNEIDIIKSKNLMAKVVQEMQLNVVIYEKHSIKSIELYDEAPFEVKLIEKGDSVKQQKFNIQITGEKFHLVCGKENIDTTLQFGKLIKCAQFDLLINKKPGAINPGGYKFTVQSADSKVEDLLKNFTVDLTDKKSTTLALTIEYSNPKKGEALLQRLMNLYLQFNLENKKLVADSTLAFIDNRLHIVSGELLGVETKFSEFKKNNSIADVDEQEKVLVGDVSDYNKKLNEQEVQLAILEDIAKYIDIPANRKVIPSSLSVQDPAFTAAISNYNLLLAERGRLSLSYKPNNPVIQNLDSEIETGRQNMLKKL